MILDYFNEPESNAVVNEDCCDVCSKTGTESNDCEEEIAAVLKVVKEFPNKGVKKVGLNTFWDVSSLMKWLQIAEFLRGYAKGLSQCDEVSNLGAGASFGLTETAWRIRTLQAWLHGLLEKTTTLGQGHGRMTKIAFHTYNITEAGCEFLDSKPLPSIVLPSANIVRVINHPGDSGGSGECSATKVEQRDSAIANVDIPPFIE